MSNPTPAITRNFYAIITNAAGDKVLLIEENNQWTLPHWQASQAYNPGEIIPWILQTIDPAALVVVDSEMVSAQLSRPRLMGSSSCCFVKQDCSVVVLLLPEGLAFILASNRARWSGVSLSSIPAGMGRCPAVLTVDVLSQRPGFTFNG